MLATALSRRDIVAAVAIVVAQLPLGLATVAFVFPFDGRIASTVLLAQWAAAVASVAYVATRYRHTIAGMLLSTGRHGFYRDIVPARRAGDLAGVIARAVRADVLRTWAQVSASTMAADALARQATAGEAALDTFEYPDDPFGERRDDDAVSLIALARVAVSRPGSSRLFVEAVASLPALPALPPLTPRELGAVARLHLLAGQTTRARQAASAMPERDWERALLTADLAGTSGSGERPLDLPVTLLNTAYVRNDLATMELADGPGAPLERLSFDTDGRSVERQDAPLVTVVMAVGSVDSTTGAAIDSVRRQTWQNWELVVVADGIAAEDLVQLRLMIEEDPRIRLLERTVSGGPYICRNEAIAVTSGEFITMQDADDVSHPERLAVQVDRLTTAPDIVGVLANAVRVTPDLRFVQRRTAMLRVAQPTLMFRRSILARAGGFDPIRRGADGEFTRRIETASGTTVPLVLPDAPLLLMRADAGSLSGGDFVEDWIHPARGIYKSAYQHWHRRESAAGRPPRFEPDSRRPFPVPAHLSGVPRPPVEEADILVVLDGQQTSARHRDVTRLARWVDRARRSGRAVTLLPVRSWARRGVDDSLPDALERRHADGALDIVDGMRPIRAKAVVLLGASAACSLPWQTELTASEFVVLVRRGLIADAFDRAVRGKAVDRSLLTLVGGPASDRHVVAKLMKVDTRHRVRLPAQLQ